MIEDLQTIHASFARDMAAAATPDDTERIRIQYLGRKSALTQVLRALKDMTPDRRRTVGEEANRLRRAMDDALAEKRAMLEREISERDAKKEWLDVTRPGVRVPQGHLHPITTITREIISIFTGLGFDTAAGPEVETEYYNFDALNIPADHPARDMWDTFWIGPAEPKGAAADRTHKSNRLLVRTHTSPVQIRYMETHRPPVRVIVPGVVYRYEATDASHDIQFSQVEGLVVDRDISTAHFKAVIGEFFARLFTPQTRIRLRPSYFPFTEPSFEIDISCVYCGAGGCAICKQSGWLEIAGAGMVHPRVFRAAGYDPKNVRGFAFGMGISRIAMMKYRIPDIRLFNSGDMRFLAQF
jgi:phenylalanyl-tRNA synthetase alpha chain